MRSQRDRLIESVNAVSGAEDCLEAVALQQRPRWVLPLAFAVFLLVRIALAFVDVAGIVAIAVASGCLGLVVGLATNHLIIASRGESVVLIRSKRSFISAVEIVKVLPPTPHIEISPGFLSHKVTIDDATYLLARPSEDRFNRIVAR